MSRLHREMMRPLVAEIVSGQRAVGEMMPREVDLAGEFGVSRGVARECLRAMEERGLVMVRHGRGATVRPEHQWDVSDPEVLGAALEGARGNELLAEYLECRRLIEVEAVGLAAQRASAEMLTEAGAALWLMERSARSEQRFHESDVSFHQALIRAAGNRPLGAMAGRLHAALVVARLPLARPDLRLERALPEHRRILEAVRAGDAAEARAAMSAHLDTVALYLAEREAEAR
jgi:DNA-binding FadR family transcriptional regulator